MTSVGDCFTYANNKTTLIKPTYFIVMSKILWDDEYLRSFVSDLLQHQTSNQFWVDENDEVVEYKDVHYRRMGELPSCSWSLEPQPWR